jgi:hypothetical protein
MKKYFKLAMISLRDALQRFPVVLISCVFMGILAIILVHESFDDFEIPAKILMGLGIFTLSSLTIKIAFECFEKITIRIYIGLIVLAAVFASLYANFSIDFDTNYSAVKYAAVIFGLVITFLAVPFVAKRKTGSDAFTNRLGWRVIITGLYTGVLIGGLAALLFAIQELLNVTLYDEIYADTAFIVLSLFTPIFFLSDIKPYEDFSPNKLYKVLLINILMPLLLAYTAVVYIYLVQIMLNNFEMPSGIVGNLVLWYSLVGVWVLFLSGKYLQTGFGKFFNRFYPPLSVLPLIAMFFALYLRIDQYGFTESRYYSVVAGIWICAMVIFFILTSLKKRNLVVVLLSLAAVAFLSIIGPWSAGAVSLNSQTRRLEAVLTEQGILVDGKIDESQTIRSEANSIVYYIDRMHGFNKVDFMTQQQADGIEYYDMENRSNGEYHKMNEDYYKPYKIAGYEYEFIINDYDDNDAIVDGIAYTLEDDVITVLIDGVPDIKIDMLAHMKKLQEQGKLASNIPFDFVIDVQGDHLNARLTLQFINYVFERDNVDIYQFDGRMLVRRK